MASDEVGGEIGLDDDLLDGNDDEMEVSEPTDPSG